MDWSRAVQLLITIALASYLIYIVVRPDKKSLRMTKEGFEQVEQELKANATEKPTFTDKDILPESQKAIKDMDTSTLTKEDFELYGNIVDVYNRTLERNPTPSEMFYHFDVMKKDKAFDLKKNLVLSKEYTIKEKAQTNMVDHETTRTINTQQVTNTIIDTYQRVVGRNPTSTTITFLREKYIEYGLDDTKLKGLIEKLEEKGASPVAPTPKKEEPPKKPSAPSAETTKKEEPAKNQSQAPSTATPKNKKEESSKNKPPAPPAPPTTKKEEAGLTKKEVSGITMIVQRPNIYNIYADSPRFPGDQAGSSAQATAQLLEEVKRDCLDKDAPLKKNPHLLADFQGNRNMDELKYACQRSTKYTNADDSGKLFPEFAWSVPQRRVPVCLGGGKCDTIPLNQPMLSHGALLQEADKTTVGSIMPDFEYKEKR